MTKKIIAERPALVAYRQCKAVNPHNPMAVAENIQKAVEALKLANKLVNALLPAYGSHSDIQMLDTTIKAVLSAIERQG